MGINYRVYAEKEFHLLAAVGLVMTKWSRLELQILVLTAWGLQTPLPEAAKLTSMFTAFNVILKFAAAACSTRLGPSEYLKSIVSMSEELSGDRNFIAHTPVAAFHPTSDLSDGSTVDYAKAIPRVGPAIVPYLTGTSPKRDAMDETEVREIEADIQHLIVAVMQFHEALSAGAPLPEKFLEPVLLRRPRLKERRELRDKVQAPPHQS